MNKIKILISYFIDYVESIAADKVTKKIKNGTMKVHNSDEVYKELGIKI